MVDNFDLINNFITFDSPNEFYFIQIIRRAKDAPYIGSNNQFIKSYNVYSHEDLCHKKLRIIDLCNRLDARAYIHLSPRNDETIALMMMEELAKLMRERQYPNTRNLWATMCGRYNPPKAKKLWVVDVDTEELTPDDYMDPHFSAKFDHLQPYGNKFMLQVPTKHGWHLIMKPFDLKVYHEENAGYPWHFDIHKNNPTVLFCP